MSSNVKALDPPDIHHLNAAEGWLGLGNFNEAEQELERIGSAARTHPDVLRVKYHLHELTKQWDRAADTARVLCQKFPEAPSGWIHQAYALHELKRTREAYDVLIPVVERFPEEYIIRYNLACYCCRMGNLEEARTWLKKAISLGGPETIKQMALADPDLQELREEIRGI